MEIFRRNRKIRRSSGGKSRRATGPNPYLYSISAALGYGLFLLFLPQLLRLIFPCLDPTMGQSFRFTECNTVLILDRFITLALIGYAVGILIMFFLQQQKTLKPIFFCACLCAVLLIIGYHTYIPRAETAARQAPILLESLRSK